MAESFDGKEEVSPRTESGWRTYIHFEWVRMPLGILKLAEGLIVIIALIIMSTIRNTAGSGYSSIEFFFFVHSGVIIMILITYCLYISNIYHRLPALMLGNLVWTVICGLGTAMLLISSAVVMDKYGSLDTILAAGAFGIIGSLLFLFETAFYFVKLRRNGPYATSGISAIMGDQGNSTEGVQY